MYRTIVAALALSLGLGTAALAQSSTTGADTSTSGAAAGSMTMPQGWQGTIADTFFSDPATGTLKSDTDIKSGWSKLSADQQAQVKSDCQSHMASAGTGTSGADKTTTSSTTANGSASTSGSASTGGSADMTASLDKLCGEIQGM